MVGFAALVFFSMYKWSISMKVWSMHLPLNPPIHLGDSFWPLPRMSNLMIGERRETPQPLGVPIWQAGVIRGHPNLPPDHLVQLLNEHKITSLCSFLQWWPTSEAPLPVGVHFLHNVICWGYLAITLGHPTRSISRGGSIKKRPSETEFP